MTITRAFINADVSHSGLTRCLRRHGLSNLRQVKADRGESAPPVAHKTFKDYEPGFIHIDVKYLPKMADEAMRAIDIQGESSLQ